MFALRPLRPPPTPPTTAVYLTPEPLVVKRGQNVMSDAIIPSYENEPCGMSPDRCSETRKIQNDHFIYSIRPRQAECKSPIYLQNYLQLCMESFSAPHRHTRAQTHTQPSLQHLVPGNRAPLWVLWRCVISCPLTDRLKHTDAPSVTVQETTEPLCQWRD